MIWLGEKRGLLTDWVTQRWVCATGRAIEILQFPWLDGPVGDTHTIGEECFREFAEKNDYELVRSGTRGLLQSFQALEADNTLASVAQPVKDFYEKTSEFEFDVWSEWRGLFKPFGHALAFLFLRRLQQLNLPLSSMDTALGMTSEVVPMRARVSGKVLHTAWIRKLHATAKVLYAGAYSVCTIPGHPMPCVRVIFPLPNGSATVILRATANPDGSLSLWSKGKSFGEPGFYFVVRDKNGQSYARYQQAIQEEIRVYSAKDNDVRTDHRLWFYGMEFLRLHYRMRRKI